MANFAAKQVAIEQNIPYIISLGYINRNYETFDYRGDQIPYFDAVAYQYMVAKAAVAVSHENLNLFFPEVSLKRPSRTRKSNLLWQTK